MQVRPEVRIAVGVNAVARAANDGVTETGFVRDVNPEVIGQRAHPIDFFAIDIIPADEDAVGAGGGE